MIVKTLDDHRKAGRSVKSTEWESIRMILEKDGFGFSYHYSIMPAGNTLKLWYKHHLEACFCIKGSATIHCLSTGSSFEILPGTLYALDKHDKHEIEIHEELVALCVFNPPLTGNEVHRSDGSYAANHNI